MNTVRKTYVLDRNPHIAAAADRAAAFLFNDAPRGAGWHGESLAGFLLDSHARLCARLEKLADLDSTLDSDEARQLRSSLETLIEAKRVWQESSEHHAQP